MYVERGFVSLHNIKRLVFVLKTDCDQVGVFGTVRCHSDALGSPTAEQQGALLDSQHMKRVTTDRMSNRQCYSTTSVVLMLIFLALITFYPLILGVEGYCFTRLHSVTHKHTHTPSVILLCTRDRPLPVQKSQQAKGLRPPA